MDHIDAKILEILQQNARTTISQLGRMINMTQPAVSERVRKLEDQGVILGYQTVLEPEKLGKHVTAFVLVKANNCGKLFDFGEQSSEVVEMHQLSGEFNFILKVMTSSLKTLDRFIHECSQYGFTTTMTVLSSPMKSKVLSMEEE
ncbi:Lrp/AsnC family transcriptional regulator [Shimazuella kribbensis]|uniref:Lrp/AsnC family transcriptional regulator n=1 Tax=Shimazuella kribbensis TaxID=139808 RepID=UPI0004243DC2|nr:AsnC family transcriptional regulator [Shimazuella kribbensis]